MKIGKMTRPEALALIEKHNGDRTEIYADLAGKMQSGEHDLTVEVPISARQGRLLNSSGARQ
ncbi:hypothetical protein [Mesorhizobium australicum]|uniref:hypothetical protein n=1 Tax=Mesorhizobium australicum TaxID=536018 RepID=UPI003335A6CB